jgi:hypothetical protein
MPAKPSEFATRDSATVTDTDKFIGIDPESTTGVGAGPAGQPFTILASELAEYVGAEIGTLTTETIQDTMSTTLVEGTDIDITYNDTTGTITIASSAAVTGVTTEQIDDEIAALHGRASALGRSDVVYDDAASSGAGTLTVYPTVGVNATRPAHREGLLFWDTTLTTPT